jgi:hypothetical protein
MILALASMVAHAVVRKKRDQAVESDEDDCQRAISRPDAQESIKAQQAIWTNWMTVR